MTSPLRALQDRFSVTFRATAASLLIAIVLFGIYTGYWYVLAARFQNGADAWIADQRARGLDVQYAALRTEGFPLRLRMVLENPRMEYANGGAPWSWTGRRAVLSTRPWNPTRMTVALSGPHRVGLMLDGKPASYAGTSQRLSAELAFTGGKATEARLRIAGLDLVSADGGGRVAVGTAALDARTHSAADSKASALDLTLEARGVVVPDRLALPLGNRIAEAMLEASLMGALPPGPLPQSLATWRDGGGTVEVTRLNIVHGPLSLQGTGTMALDAQLQPIGAFTVKIRGFVKTIGLLRERGIMRSRDAITAQLLLGVLAKRPEDGGPPTLNLPLTLQSRKLYVGPVTLTRLPEVDWQNLEWEPPGR